jgi:microcystin-dependent protein
MADPFVAEIRMVGFNFAPVGWALTNGQLLPISQNTAVFSLLGTQYGGDGTSNFALPNLQGSVPIHTSEYGSPAGGLSTRLIGQTGGSETATFNVVPTAANPAAPITAMTLAFNGVSTASPYLVLTFIIALQGVFPSRS